MTADPPRPGWRGRIIKTFVLAAFSVCLLAALLETFTSAPGWVGAVLFGGLFGFVFAPLAERWKRLSTREKLSAAR